MTIDQNDFKYWLESPVTIEIFTQLKELDESYQAKMLSPSWVLCDDGRANYARAAGAREVIERILTLTVEDLVLPPQEEEEEIDDDDEEISSSNW